LIRAPGFARIRALARALQRHGSHWNDDATSWSWAAGVTALLILAVFALVQGLNFAHWDNTETFLPALWYAHTQLLSGHFPLWNPLQNLGEPLHALGIGGVLYPPYTIAIGSTRLFGWPEAVALDLTAVAHIALGAIGLTRLLQEFRVRGPVAFTAGLSAVFSGYALVMGSIWVHTLPNIAWSIWAMWGLRRVIANEHAGSGVVVATVALGVVFTTGHVQMAVNVWLSVWAWAFFLALAYGVLRQRLPVLLAIALAGALLALPALLPTALILGDASRIALEEVLSGLGFRPTALAGLLAPVIALDDGAFIHTVLIMTFVGAWVAPALVLGLGAGHSESGDDARLRRAFLATLAAALLFVWLNFGPPAKLYSILHGLPVFSHFRNPFKYWERALVLLVAAGALGLELALRREPVRAWRLVVAGLLGAALVFWLQKPAKEPLTWLSGTCALLTIAALAFWPAARALRVIVPLTVIECVGVLAIAQSAQRSKPYVIDRQESSRLTFADTHRVLPLSAGPSAHPYTRPLSLFYAASLDGYESASGHRFALTSRRLTDYLNADITGRPFRGPQFERLLRSNWLRLADVGHLVVENGDLFAFDAVKRRFPEAPETITKYATIFHIEPNWPRAYFGTQQADTGSAAVKEILYGAAPISAVSVAGDARVRKLPPARVDSLAFGPGRIAARVYAPAGGLLVFSTSYSSEWVARVDDRRLRVVPVNGMFAGVWVPPGAERVQLGLRSWPLLLGLAAALAGLLLTSAIASWATRARRS
jgi:hypothetical protein